MKQHWICSAVEFLPLRPNNMRFMEPNNYRNATNSKQINIKLYQAQDKYRSHKLS